MLVHMMLAKQNFDDDNSGAAFTNVRRAYSKLVEGFTLQRSFGDFYFSTGLYKYYRELLAENYPVYSKLAGLFFPPGDKREGLLCLDPAITSALLVKPDALMWACTINLRYEGNKAKGLYYAAMLAKTYPGNFYFKTIYIEALIQSGHYADATLLLDQLKAGDNEYYKLSAALFRGMLEEHKETPDWQQAERFYKAAIEQPVKTTMINENYIGLAHYYLGKIY
jgi:hypothetical protein